MVDISAAGLRVRSVVLVEEKTELEGTLILEGGERIHLRGKVVWASPPDHRGFLPAEFGLVLKTVPEAYLRALARLFADSE